MTIFERPGISINRRSWKLSSVGGSLFAEMFSKVAFSQRSSLRSVQLFRPYSNTAPATTVIYCALVSGPDPRSVNAWK